MPRPRIRRFADLESMASAAAEDVIGCIDRAVREVGCCRLAVAGGSTPRPIYRLLAEPEFASRVEWEHVHIFWGDERYVPPTDQASNYRMVQEQLLDLVPIPRSNVHRIETERTPEDAARTYAETLGGIPLDLVLLGMGEDGHTASLFPGTPNLGQHVERVIATISPRAPIRRVSLTLRTINEAGAVRFWVSGSSKAGRVSEVFGQIEAGEPHLPAAHVNPHSGCLCWFVDAEAAREL